MIVKIRKDFCEVCTIELINERCVRDKKRRSKNRPLFLEIFSIGIILINSDKENIIV